MNLLNNLELLYGAKFDRGNIEEFDEFLYIIHQYLAIPIIIVMCDMKYWKIITQ